MAKIEVVAAVLVVASLLAGAWAAVPGPNDLRYPDYIVNPPVQCTTEGSFHHPRNCSWYYRCVDRMKIGYFHTFYFECEPGTVFSDELDQCVFPHLIGPPCGSEDIVTCEYECYTQQLCQPAETRVYCTRCRRGQQMITTETFCGKAGAVYDKERRQCVVTPVPVTRQCSSISVPCIFGDQDCKTQKLCHPSEERVICERCRRGQEVITAGVFCGDPGLVYEKTRGQCVSADVPASRQCWTVTPTATPPVTPTATPPVTPTATPPVTPTATPTVTPTATPSVPVLCVFNSSVCEKRKLCQPQETVTLCSHCYFGATLIDYCGKSKGLIYDLDRKICVPEPDDSRVCDATVPVENTVECSDSNTRPGHDWIKRFYCTRYNLCDANNKYKDAVSLCSNYYQCYKNADGSWFVELRNCVDGKLYSFDNDRCENKPSDDQLCT